MHSRIYQITTSPVPSQEYLSENYFSDHWFVGSVADYVSGDLNRDNEIAGFKKSLTENKVALFHDSDCFSILPEGKESYFKNAYEQFNKAAKKAASVSLEAFAASDECSSLVYVINGSFCEKFGLYVSSDEFETIPLDEFIRYAEPEERYYIGNVLDYHY